MPIGQGNNSGEQRTNFRPPWVKEDNQTKAVPAAPWTIKNRGQKEAAAPAQKKQQDGQKQNNQSQPDGQKTQPQKNNNNQKQPQKNQTPQDGLEQKGPPARKTSTVKIVPIQPAPAAESEASENGTKDPHVFELPKLREVLKPEHTKLQSKEVKVPVSVQSRQKENPIQVHIESLKRVKEPEPRLELKADPFKDEVRQMREVLKKVEREPQRRDSLRRIESFELKRRDSFDNRKEVEIDRATPVTRNAMVRQDSLKKLAGLSIPVAPPMAPPMPPPPPPDMIGKIERLSTEQQKEKLQQLKTRPKKRPDWTTMMKDIEAGCKLKHVQCNDRSRPLLPKNKAKGQFIYESEKSNMHNQLLKEIQSSVKLKHVKCNDRSKPILEGLRKFRRQMTIEEQIQKSQSLALMPEAEIEDEVDEMDDIDKIRDDLQSTKQLLALELRNKEAQIRENKRLQARILNLEAELEKEREMKSRNNNTEVAPPTSNIESNNVPASDVDNKLIGALKQEAEEARKTSEELEKRYNDTATQLDNVKIDLEDARRQNQMLEKKLALLQGDPSAKLSTSERRESTAPAKEPEPSTEEESESSEEEGVDEEEKAKRRAEREVRLLRNKLKSYKNKEEAARKERKNLRDQMRKNQRAINEEKKKYKHLQAEVNKMAALMKDDEEEDDEEKEDDEEVEEEEEVETEEESETESESESSEEEEESESEPEDSPLDKKKDNIMTRSKRHENILNALKKGNYMLKANVDRLQDDLNKQKEMVVTLQEDLDSVLAELG